VIKGGFASLGLYEPFRIFAYDRKKHLKMPLSIASLSLSLSGRGQG
jgi:hypothetical protein